jgi:CSLREA domain-containing protein/uncharacterized repeat protein (TIGR01451 family)
MHRFSPSPNNLRVFNACLLSFLTLLAPIASVGAATIRATAPASEATRTTKNQPTTQVEPAAAPASMSVPAAMPVPGLTATKVDAFADSDGDGKAALGETINYTVNINNSGTDATGVTFNDTIDANTTFVAGSMNVSPLAFDDAYTAIGNTLLEVGTVAGANAPKKTIAGNVLSNDTDFLGDTFTISAFQATSAQSGTVNMVTSGGNAGSFTYISAANFTGTDTFTYTIRDDGTDSIPGNADDLTGVGTVTITVANQVWYVDKSFAGTSDGRSTNPYKTLTEVSGATGSDSIGDIIFIRSLGAGNYTGGITLLDGQTLWGENETLIVDGFTLLASGIAPVIENASGAGITLEQDNIIKGLTVGTTNTYDIANTTTATVGTLTIFNVDLNGNGGLFRADSGGAITATFDTATTTLSSLQGVLLSGGVTGSLIFNSASIAGTTGIAFSINGGNATVDFNGPITKTTNGVAIDVQSKTGGTVSFDGAVSSQTASDGINLVNNSGTTITFTGALTIDTSSSNTPGFTATGGGTVSSTASGSTINSGTGTALNVANTNIGASDLTFQSITSSGGTATGIIVDNTGSAGGLHVVGTGGAGTGGTIANKTGANASTSTGVGIYLNNTAEAQFDRMQLNGFQNFAIQGADVNGFSLQNSVVNGVNGNDSAFDEGSIFLRNCNGTLTITNADLSGGLDNNLRVLYDSATPDTAVYNVTSSTFRDLQTLVNDSLVELTSMTTASTSSNVTFNFGSTANAALGNNFENDANTLPPGGTENFSDGILVTFEGGFQHTLNIDNNTFHHLFQAMDMASNFSADIDYRVYSNDISFTEGVAAIAFGSGSSSTAASLIQALIEDNNIGTAAGDNTGSRLGEGIVGDFRGAETARVTLHQNVIQNTEVNGIRVISQATSGDGDVHLRITNNTVASIDDNAGGGFGVIYGIEVTTNAATNGDIFADIRANDSHNVNAFDIRVRQATLNNTFSLEDFAGTGTSAPSVEAFLAAQNPLCTTNVRTGGSVVNYTSHNLNNTNTPAPLTPLMAAPGGVEAALSSFDLLFNNLRSGALTQAELDPLVAAAMDRWSAAGLTRAQTLAMRELKFELGDLTGSYLGEAGGNRIVVDRDAGGRGWFVDATPMDDLEFGERTSATRSYTNQFTSAAGRIDLLTAIEHEIGHKLGLDDSYSEKDRNSIMYGYLTVGERRLPAANQAKGAQPGSLKGPHFLSLSREAKPRSVITRNSATTSPVMAPMAPMPALTPVSIGTLPGGKSLTIVFQVTVKTTGLVPANATSVSNQGTVSGSNFANVLTDDTAVGGAADPTVTNISRLDLQLTKTDGVTSTTPGSTLTYVLTYTNLDHEATGVVLTETVPTGTTFNAAGSDPSWVEELPAGSGIYKLTLGTVPRFNLAGHTGTKNFAVTVNNPAAAGLNSISNTASIDHDETAYEEDINLANNTATDTNTTLNAAPDLTVSSKSDGVTNTTPGSTLTYTINYANSGNQGAANVVLTETVPTGTVYVAAGSSGWSCANGSPGGTVCTLSLGTLNGGGAGGSATFIVTVNSPAVAGQSSIVNIASIADDGANGADATPANNSQTDTNILDAAPDLTVSKTANTANATPGQIITYTINYSNIGNQGSTGIVITETVPVDTTFDAAGSLPTVWSCPDNSAAGTTCTTSGGALAGGGGAGTAKTFAVEVIASPAGTIVPNTVSIADDGTNGTDSNTANNTFGPVNVNICSNQTVTNTNDTGAGSLRQAIADVCDGGTITFNIPILTDPGCNAGAGPCTIILGSQLSVAKSVTIDGPTTQRVIVSGSNLYRVFDITVGTVNINELTISNGQASAGANGAGISNAATLNLTAVTVSGNNQVPDASGNTGGGGIYNSGTLTLTNSTVSGNHADTGAGAGNGGGILNSATGTLTLTNCTVSDNVTDAGGQGGGINNLNAGPNTANLQDTIVANNTVGAGGAGSDLKGEFNSLNYNLIESTTDATFTGTTTNNITLLDPNLGLLANNGGPTFTHALQPGSPAIDAGNSALTTDQRGSVRPADNGAPANVANGTDIGAFEVADTTAPTADITDVSPDPRNTLVGSITIVFSEVVQNADLGDLTLTLNGGGNLLPGPGPATLTTSDNITFTLNNINDITAAPGTYLLTVSVSNITDTAGNPLAANATDQWVTDTTAPTVTSIDDGDTDNIVLTGGLLTYTVTFSEDIDSATVTAADFDNAGTSAITIGTVTETNPTSGVFNVQVTPTTPGTLILRVGAGINDTAGNALSPAPVSDNDTLTVLQDNFAGFVVTKIADTNDGTCDADCSLREAIVAANADAGAETITFDTAGVFATPQTITLNALGALPDIDTDLTIAGPVAAMVTVARDNAATNFRIFKINSGKTVTISVLTMTNGATGGALFPDSSGGGILNEGTLTLQSSIVTDNTAANFGGGGIYNLNGNLTVKSSTISLNDTLNGGAGGGIYSNGGTVTVTSSSITGNTSTGNSGGIHNDLATLNVTNSTVSGNTGNSGAGITNFGPMSLTNSTISGNNASGDGGGIYNNHSAGSVTLTNVTISNNIADSDGNNTGVGGGLYVFSTSLQPLLKNTIIAGNFNEDGASDAADDINGTVDPASTFNLIGTGGAGGLTAPNNQVNVASPGLGILAPNGGPTQTHLLTPGSLAINAGSNALLPVDTYDVDGDADTGETLPTDQRGVGFPRVVNTTVDIGAVEVNYTISATAGTPQSTVINTAFATNLEATVTESGNPQSGVTVTFTAPVAGASGAFAGSVNTATTNASGVATAVVFTANGTTGSYNVVASLPGGSPLANFALTNTISGQTITVNTPAPASAVFGSNFTVAATASSGLTVTYSSGTPTVCTNSGATFTMISGTGTCTVQYNQAGDSNYSPAPQVTNSVTATKAATTTAVTSSANPSDHNQNLTFTATVTSATAGTRTGTVQFKVDGTNLGAPQAINGSGVATIQTATLTPGTHVITADYNGDANFATSTGTLAGGQLVRALITINDVSLTEGDAGNKTFAFTVTLSAASNQTVTVNYASADGIATAPSDYTAITPSPTTLTFLATETTKTVNVTVKGDTDNEPNETFFVNLTAGNANGTISDNQGQGMIVNDDTATFQFAVTSSGVLEATGFVEVTVNRIGDLSLPMTVDYTTADGTATERKDYTTAIGTLRFAAGEATKKIVVMIEQDSFTEGSEQFALTLSNPSGGGVVGVPASSTIVIDDSASPAPDALRNARNFVRRHYHDFLNREPDTAGLDFWTEEITDCGSDVDCLERKRVDVSASFFLSIEFQETGFFAIRSQRVAFGKRSQNATRITYPELLRDSRQLGEGVIIPDFATLEQNKLAYTQQIVTSAAFATAFPQITAADYVDALYSSAGVTPTPTERSDAIVAYNTAGGGMTEKRVAGFRKVVDSTSVRDAEFRQAFVLMEYYGYLRRTPDQPGYDFWLNKLNTFNGNFVDAEMVKAFIVSIEYKDRYIP